MRRQAGRNRIRLAHRRRPLHPRLRRESRRRGLLRGPLAGGRLRDTGPAANCRLLRHLRSHWRLSPRIHGRLLGRLHRPAALLRQALWRHSLLRWRHTWLPRPPAERLLRLTSWRILLPPRIGRRLRRQGLAGPRARRLLRHNRLLRLRSGLRIRLHRARLRPTGLLRHHRLLRHDRLLRRRTLARPASLLRREADYAEQPDRLSPALRTTKGLRGPLNLEAAVRTAKGVHGLDVTSQPRWPSCRLCRCRGGRSIPRPGRFPRQAARRCAGASRSARPG